MPNNLEWCDCGSKALNLTKEQIDDFWEAHDDCGWEFEYVQPKGVHSAECVCGDSVTSFSNSWFGMWVEVHCEH